MKKIYRIKKVTSIPSVSFVTSKRKQEETKHSNYSDGTFKEELQEKKRKKEELNEESTKNNKDVKNKDVDIQSTYNVEYFNTRNSKLYKQLNTSSETSTVNDKTKHDTSVKVDNNVFKEETRNTNTTDNVQKKAETSIQETTKALTKREETRIFKDSIKPKAEEKETLDSSMEKFEKALKQKKAYESKMKGFKHIRGRNIGSERD